MNFINKFLPLLSNQTLFTMILCAFALTLLAIVAGMMLLAQTKKDNLGNLYKYVSLFVIVMGFLSILCIGARCAMMCCNRGMHVKMMQERMMMRDGDDGEMMMHHMRGDGMMGCHRGMMDGCGMMRGGCCGGMGNGCYMNDGCGGGMDGCQNGMGSCKEGGMGECKDGNMGGSCPMMKGDMHCTMKDSAKKK